MNEKEFEALLKKPANIRYEYFIKKVVDYKEVWGLFNDGWATASDGKGGTLIPFFPKEEFAINYARKEWAEYKAEPIELIEFINDWLVGMKNDGVKPSIFPTEIDTAVMSIEVLKRDLEEELENY